MLQMKTRHWEMVKNILGKYPHRFYVYGSRVKGNAKKFSDLGLCFQEKIPWNVLGHIQEDFEESNLPFKVDLVNWEWMSADFKKLIKDGLTPIDELFQNYIYKIFLVYIRDKEIIIKYILINFLLYY